MRKAHLAGIVALAAVVVTSSPLQAQMAPAAFARPPVSAVRQAPHPPRFVTEASNYLGWGAVIGAAAGVTYAAVTEDGDRRKFLMLVDGLIGFGAGLLGGATVFLIRKSL